MHHIAAKSNLVDSGPETDHLAFRDNNGLPLCPKPRRLRPAIPNFLAPLRCAHHIHRSLSHLTSSPTQWQKFYLLTFELDCLFWSRLSPANQVVATRGAGFSISSRERSGNGSFSRKWIPIVRIVLKKNPWMFVFAECWRERLLVLQLLSVLLFRLSSWKNRESTGSRRVFSSSNGASFAIFEDQALCLAHMNRRTEKPLEDWTERYIGCLFLCRFVSEFNYLYNLGFFISGSS